MLRRRGWWQRRRCGCAFSAAKDEAARANQRLDNQAHSGPTGTDHDYGRTVPSL
ncbi:LPP leucine zipper domain-containing protein [Streptomyces sp. NPDC102409]|uniref:LPP leucine zipper domain-containing protein n=1 Tax=Streptomyces sp. NPDC102409 TaxID=3366172 RepID=UPI00381C98C7